MKAVDLYTGRDCHLCDVAREVLDLVGADTPFALREHDITGDPVLEARYREWLPVVEIDGRRVFVYRVDAAELRSLLAAQG